MRILRHAAALALVGWYLLMAPGTKRCAEGSPCPLPLWDVWHVYDTAAECTEGQEQVAEKMKNAETNPGADNGVAHRAMEETTRCIASDDPRLK